jgi:hypothetical protein
MFCSAGGLLSTVHCVLVNLGDAQAAGDERQVRAPNRAFYKLTQLSAQMHKSRRAWNHLRSIRRLLFSERELDDASEASGIAKPASASI